MSLSLDIQEQIRRDLQNDRVHDDVTTRLLGLEAGAVRAVISSRQEGVFAGGVICKAFQSVLPVQVSVEALVSDGATLSVGTRLVLIEGPLGACLSLERTLLNYLGHLCGVASLTRKYVDSVLGSRTRILATRKTLPGLRELQLAAVTAGGGRVHRRSLSDGILIKDNHQTFAESSDLIARARKVKSPLHRVEVEVQSLDALPEILEARPDVIMLDNLPIDILEKAIAMIGDLAEIEVSGGIRLEDVARISALGVDYISVGALTHSAPSLNLTMDLEPA